MPRSAIDPAEFFQLLPQVFILGRRGPGRYGFRLVGGLLQDLHGADLRQADFLPLWRGSDRADLQGAMEQALRRPQPLVVQATGRAGETAVGLEVLLAPLTGLGGAPDRFLGLYQPTSPLSRLQGRALERLHAESILAAGEDAVAAAPRLRLAALDGRRLA